MSLVLVGTRNLVRFLVTFSLTSRYTRGDAIKIILSIAAKTHYLVRVAEIPNPVKRETLEQEVLNWTIEKLPADMAETFNDLPVDDADALQPKKTMDTMTKFLSDQMFDAFVARGGRDEPPKRWMAPERDLHKEEKVCHYCKSTVHTRAFCGFKRSVLCFKCFAFGK